MDSQEHSPPALYRVSWSEHVRDELRRLLARAKAVGRGTEYLAAARELDARLRIYPQFGEPIIDLKHETGKIWLGTIGPLVARYAIYEDLRLVVVATPVMEVSPLPG